MTQAYAATMDSSNHFLVKRCPPEPISIDPTSRLAEKLYIVIAENVRSGASLTLQK